jgi:drug/metabolite transporter, DME family
VPYAARQAFAALPDHRQGMLAVLAAAVLWSTGGLFIKAVSLDALGVTMWRALLAGAALAVLTRTMPANPLRASRLEWALAVSYALMLVLFVSATKLTTAANAIFLQYTAPLYVLVLSPVLLGERPSRTDLVCVAAAFGGMALFFVGRLEPDDLGGNVCALASGAAFAVFLTLLRMPGCGPKTRPRAMILGNGLLVVSLLAVNLGRGESAPFTPGLADIAGLVFLGVLQIGLAYALFGYGIARVQALEASLIGMLEPVLNPLWVLIFLGETPGWWAVAGGAVIVAAVAIRTWLTERGRATPAAADETRIAHAEAHAEA